jgi:L-lactate dehydrogenase complex protein LldG
LHEVDSPEEVSQQLNKIDEYSAARQIVSLVPEAAGGNTNPSDLPSPHSLASLDWVIVRGEFLVAENGAIWIDGNKLPHRVMLFITQYLAIVVSRKEFVHNLHEAYQRIGNPKPSFGIFVAGPSKTADIEQSLVLGAHGCRALQVFLTP